jgi:hypothetical protein
MNREGHTMSITAGFVKNGVVVPNTPLPEGAQVEVTIVPQRTGARFASALDFLQSLPPGPRAFKTWEEYEQHLRQEKDAWERQ